MLGDKQNVDHSAGNFAVGQNITQIYVQAPADMLGLPHIQPEVPTFDLKLAMVDGEPDISRLLRWNYRLVPKLFGRDKEIADIIRWAESDDPQILLRLVEGEGGSGKTRLAAEAALALKERGWNAGFMASTGPLLHPAGKSGLFLILDYPEEQRERVNALVDSVRARTSPGYRLRILLLSRRSFERWTELDAIRDLIGRQPIARLGPLTQDEARSLVVEASNRLSLVLGNSKVDDFKKLDDWLAANEDNRISLYATAAAVHHVLSKDQTFTLRRTDIVQDLVKREQARVDKVSEKEGLGRHALARLLALASISGGLTAKTIERLSEPDLHIFECPKNQVMNRLRDLPWWDRDGNMLLALTPDILAALFTSHILKQTEDIAPRWLWTVLQERVGSDFAARVGRIVHDIDFVEGKPSPLPQLLEQILVEDPSRASVFAVLTIDEMLPHRLAGLAASTCAALAEIADDDERRSLFLNNMSVALGNAGRIREALAGC
jgi:hypothetical protein